ncbi:hypothetical protein [Stutzerimonas stutzeri]|uniref:hypothetical protein n=1 Tax=Stutzerimonas stutzeri TaxID=316 RepID=UPI001BD0944A|nr:hypothetical protein [Stutzerimonas stutzeri]
MSFDFRIEMNGKLLDVRPTAKESLMGALERTVSADVGEPIRQSKCVARTAPCYRRAIEVTFESGICWRAYIIPRTPKAAPASPGFATGALTQPV